MFMSLSLTFTKRSPDNLSEQIMEWMFTFSQSRELRASMTASEYSRNYSDQGNQQR